MPFSDDDRRSAIDYAKRAILEAGGDARVLGTASIVLMHCAKDYEQALQLARTAVENNPNSLNVMTSAAVVQLHCGGNACQYQRPGRRAQGSVATDCKIVKWLETHASRAFPADAPAGHGDF